VALAALLFSGGGAFCFDLNTERLALLILMELPSALAILLGHRPESSGDKGRGMALGFRVESSRNVVGHESVSQLIG